jgi:phosphatidylglycerophosphatase A
MIKRLLTSCFGLGLLPGAPGTWGSLLPAIAFWLVFYSGGTGLQAFLLMLVFVIAGAVICIRFSDTAIAATGKKDPREVVTDEVAGQAITFIILSFSIDAIQSVSRLFIVTAAGFALFRLFDIIKPWPVKQLEKLPAGWGILADDLMAGVYAGILLVLAAKFWILK